MKWLLKQSILWHRYLGICFCVFFCFWFVSGIVMMYAGFPVPTEAEMLAHTPALDLSTAKYTPDEAIAQADLEFAPERVVIGMLGARPVYRLSGEEIPWTTVFADTGHMLGRIGPATATQIAASYDGVPPSKLRAVRELKRADQWTIYPGSEPYFPFQLIAADDGKGTEYYVSERTGTVYLRTDRRSRFFAWIGAIPHWWYIRALRAHNTIWERTMIGASGLGVLLCLAGMTVGILRFSPSRRYRFPGDEHRAIPYAGWKRWHYLFTMIFGLATFTWILSGLFTMDPGNWSPGADPEADEMAAFAGGYLDTSTFAIAPAQAAAALRPCLAAATMEMMVFGGQPYYLAHGRDGQARLIAAGAPGAPSPSAQTAPGAAPIAANAPAASPQSRCGTTVPLPALLAASARAVGGAPAVDSALLTSYDAYYYDRTRQKPLPVLRVRFADARSTWLYVDPATARIAARLTNRSRLERWLYQGLHDLDFPFLYWHRPAWDITVIVLSLGGIALSVTGIVMAFDYSRRSVRRNFPSLRR